MTTQPSKMVRINEFYLYEIPVDVSFFCLCNCYCNKMEHCLLYRWRNVGITSRISLSSSLVLIRCYLWQSYLEHLFGLICIIDYITRCIFQCLVSSGLLLVWWLAQVIALCSHLLNHVIMSYFLINKTVTSLMFSYTIANSSCIMYIFIFSVI